MERKTFRIIDANLNRAIEGMRVCEEIMRFIVSDKKLTLAFKRLRHRIIRALKIWNINSRLLLASRESSKDAGKASIKSELKRGSYKDIFFANIQRVKESIRVLEEFAKLTCAPASGNFKNIRYHLYQLEKKASPKLLSIRNH